MRERAKREERAREYRIFGTYGDFCFCDVIFRTEMSDVDVTFFLT